MLVSLEISKLVLFPAYRDGPLSLSTAITKPVIPSSTNGDVTFPHSSSFFNCTVFTVDPEELVLSRPICVELLHLRFQGQSPYYFCKLVVRKTVPAAPVDTFYTTLIISFLTTRRCVSMPIYFWQFNLHPGLWLNCWVSAKFLCFSISRKEMGSTTTQSSRFENEKQCSMVYTE